DEASMVDLALMARLFAALPPASRLILLGDKDQLASVEAGAVLGDICQAGVRKPLSHAPDQALNQAGSRATASTREHTAELENTSPLARCIVQLRKNYRFGVDNGILALSRAINDGAAGLVVDLLNGTSTKREGIAAAPLPTRDRMKENLRERVLS